ncbi:MFS transporter [Acidicapsa ligni]|uniref:MFS transporter n=1 Tax=Acidicapsa ligni TaxID=542300 RepID=UPI0021E0B64F|nr:MFS transporter [Acidicapsa ligni]
MSTSATQSEAPGAATPRAALSMREVLRITTMRRLWYAQIVSNLGDFVALFAVIGLLTYKLHATAQQVTGVNIAYQVPIAILGILAGVFVDRWPLKRTLISSDVIRGLLCLLLLVSTQIWHFYVILAAISVVSSFFGPAQGVVIREAVPFHGLRSSNALMQQVMFIMRIIGPAAAGVLVGMLGWRACYIVDAASFFASACFIASVTIKRSPAVHQHTATEDKGAVAKIWHDMQQGLSFILHHAGLLFVILALAAGMFIMGCFGPLIAVYVRDSIHAGNTIYAWASGLIGAGILCGINLLNTFGTKIKNTILVYSGLLGIAAGLVLLFAVTAVWSTLFGDFIIGFSVAGIIIPAQTLMQQETPPELMGRVGSTMMSVIFSAQILGLLVSGALAQATSVRTVFALCAVVLVLFTLIGKFFMEPKTSK